MSITLSPLTEDLIRRWIDTGAYRNVEELIEDALQALDERDRLARLRAAIASGDAQIARGASISYTDDLMDEIELEAEEAILRGELPDPNVCPSATAADTNGGTCR